MLTAILESEASLGATILKDHSVSKSKTNPNCNGANTTASCVQFSKEFKIMLAWAGKEANAFRDYYVGTHHVVLAMLRGESEATERLRSLKISRDTVLASLLKLSKQAPLVD